LCFELHVVEKVFNVLELLAFTTPFQEVHERLDPLPTELRRRRENVLVNAPHVDAVATRREDVSTVVGRYKRSDTGGVTYDACRAMRVAVKGEQHEADRVTGCKRSYAGAIWLGIPESLQMRQKNTINM